MSLGPDSRHRVPTVTGWPSALAAAAQAALPGVPNMKYSGPLRALSAAGSGACLDASLTAS